MAHVAVVGAGLAGLAAAFRLREAAPHLQVSVFDAAARPGGNLRTTERNGYRVEWGPNGFLDSKPATLELCRDLGIAGELVAASEGSRTNRFVLHNGKIERLPGGPLDLLRTPLLSLRGKLSLLAEPLRGRGKVEDESVAAFARRRLGREAAQVFLEALVTGVHAADPDRLSLRAAFPRLAEFEASHRSLLRGVLASSKAKRRAAKGETPAVTRMWSFPGGLQRLVDRLAEVLAGCIHLNTPVESVRREAGRWLVATPGQTIEADAVVLTSPAGVQARQLAALPELAAELAAVAYSPVAVVALGYRVADCPLAPDGFGYIAPPRLNRDVLGVQWCSAIFPGRAPAGHVLWRALCGGALRPDVMDWDDATLAERVHAEMRAVMQVRGTPAFTEIVRWPKAIPHYTVGHPARVARVRALTPPGLWLTGNAFEGVAMNDVCDRARAVGAEVAALASRGR